MAQQSGYGPSPGPGAAAGWPSSFPARTPSGLFPAGPAPLRPVYREPHPVSGSALAAGASLTAAWLLFFGLLGHGLAGYAWWTVLAGAVAWLTAVVLIRIGDRGVAAGIALMTAVGWSIAATAVAISWLSSGNWPLW